MSAEGHRHSTAIIQMTSGTSTTHRALSLGQKIDRWMVNEGERRIFVFVLMALHLMVFVFGMISFLIKDDLTIARSTLGITYPIAKSSALVLHFDVILILLPVCRSLVSFFRNTPLGTIIPFDKNITFHKFIAWSIVLFSWIRKHCEYRIEDFSHDYRYDSSLEQLCTIGKGE